MSKRFGFDKPYKLMSASASATIAGQIGLYTPGAILSACHAFDEDSCPFFLAWFSARSEAVNTIFLATLEALGDRAPKRPSLVHSLRYRVRETDARRWIAEVVCEALDLDYEDSPYADTIRVCRRDGYEEGKETPVARVNLRTGTVLGIPGIPALEALDLPRVPVILAHVARALGVEG